MNLEYKSRSELPWRALAISRTQNLDIDYWLSIGLIYSNGDRQETWLYRVRR